MIRHLAIGKNILIWQTLNDKQLSDILCLLCDMIQKYRQLGLTEPIPLRSNTKGQYLTICKKGNDVLLSVTKCQQGYICGHVLYADTLYKSYNLFKYQCDVIIQQRAIQYQNKPAEILYHHPYIQAVSSYTLEPTVNYSDFIDTVMTNKQNPLYDRFLQEEHIEITRENAKEPLKSVIIAFEDMYMRPDRV